MIVDQHAVRQWDNWLESPLGKNLLQNEKKYLADFMIPYPGLSFGIIGMDAAASLFNKRFSHQVLIPPLQEKFTMAKYGYPFKKMELEVENIDILVLHHTLEYAKDPLLLLEEAKRLIAPLGYIIIIGFHPYSFIRLTNCFKGNFLNHLHFLSISHIKRHLTKINFTLIQYKRITLDVETQSLYQLMRHFFSSLLFLTDFYLVIAKANQVHLTPIKLNWQTKLTPMNTPVTPTTTMRNFL